MKLLHLIPSLGQGGAERQLSLLAPALAHAGIECHIACAAGGRHRAALDASPVLVHCVNPSSNHDPRLFFSLRSLMHRLQPDIVQTWLLQMDVLGGLAAMASGRPFVLSERASAEAYPAGWKSALRLATGRRAAAIVANSEVGLEYWRNSGVTRGLHVVRNCVTLAKPVSPATLPNLPGRELIVFAGRLAPQKNAFIMLDAFEQALRLLPGHCAVLFGDGPQRPELEDRIRRSPWADRIVLQGHTEHLPYWLQHASVFVSVSHFEGHPNVVLEAAAAGCPLVLSNIAAHREVLGDDAAFFADRHSAEDIARQLVTAASDRTEATARAARARLAIAPLSVDATAGQYLHIYEQLKR